MCFNWGFHFSQRASEHDSGFCGGCIITFATKPRINLGSYLVHNSYQPSFHKAESGRGQCWGSHCVKQSFSCRVSLLEAVSLILSSSAVRLQTQTLVWCDVTLIVSESLECSAPFGPFVLSVLLLKAMGNFRMIMIGVEGSSFPFALPYKVYFFISKIIIYYYRFNNAVCLWTPEFCLSGSTNSDL